MQTVVVAPATELIVSLDDAKKHLRIDDLDNDETILGFVQAAIAMLDGPEAWLGRALGTQTLELRASHFPGFCIPSNGLFEPYAAGYGPGNGFRDDFETFQDYGRPQAVRLLCPPVQSIVSVKYLDSTGTDQTLDASAYQLDDRFLFPAVGTFWPSAQIAPSSVRIRYVAGYPDGQVPAPILAAIKLMLGTLYEGRDTSAAGMFTGAISYLLANYRVVM